MMRLRRKLNKCVGVFVCMFVQECGVESSARLMQGINFRSIRFSSWLESACSTRVRFFYFGCMTMWNWRTLYSACKLWASTEIGGRDISPHAHMGITKTLISTITRSIKCSCLSASRHTQKKCEWWGDPGRPNGKHAAICSHSHQMFIFNLLIASTYGIFNYLSTSLDSGCTLAYPTLLWPCPVSPSWCYIIPLDWSPVLFACIAVFG